MRRRLSAISTPFYKFVLPAIWLAASLAVIVLLIGQLPNIALWSLLLLLPPVLMAYFFAPLKYVAADDTRLYVSNYLNETRPYRRSVASGRTQVGTRFCSG